MTNLQAVPFTYIITSPTLAANSSGVSTLRLQADSQFEVHYFFGVTSADVATNVQSNNFSVQITDIATGRQLSNVRVPQSLFSGSAFNGSLEGRFLRLVPNSDLSFDFLNLTGGSITVTVAMKGAKLFEL